MIKYWTKKGEFKVFDYTNIPVSSLHREDGPAKIDYVDGKIVSEWYYINGKKHRNNNPALTYFDYKKNIAMEYYYQNDELHREDGPAFINYNRGENIYEAYYLNNYFYTEEKHIFLVKNNIIGNPNMRNINLNILLKLK